MFALRTVRNLPPEGNFLNSGLESLFKTVHDQDPLEENIEGKIY
jgi:hypothetical protein